MIVRGTVLSILVLPILGLGALAQADDAPSRVLVIHSFGRDFEPFASVSRGFRSELARLSPDPIEFVDVSLQAISLDQAQGEHALVGYLSATFRGRPPALVVAVGASAALLYETHRERLFPEVPFLVVGADQRRVGHLAGHPATACVNLDIDLPGIMEDIVEIFPGTRNVYIVTGVSPLEQFWAREMMAVWADSHPQVDCRPLTHLPLDDLLVEVARLPPDSAIFFAILDRDAAGIPHAGHRALRRVSRFSNAPVFGFSAGQLGEGIVGGRLMDMRKAGGRGAEVAVGLLEGNPGATARVDPLVSNPPAYDWRQLDRWSVDEFSLPPGNRVLFRERSLWETHRGTVLVTAGVIGLQAVLIFLLVAARRRARSMRDSLNLAADAANVGLWRVTLGQEPIEATGKFRQIYGFPDRGEIRLDDVLARINPDDRSVVRDAVEESARDGKAYLVEHRIELPGGEERWVLTRGRADRSGGGERLTSRGASVDVTDRKRAEEEAFRQREQLSHLSRVGSLGVISGSLAHELNQPLTSILTNAQAARRIIDRDEPDLPEIREILDDIVGEDHRAERVIQRWRDLLRRGDVASEPVDVSDCLEEVLGLVRTDFLARGISVRITEGSPLSPVMADPVQLQQVLLNLLLNAADAVGDLPPERRIIELSASLRADEVRITVQDRGPGLSGDPEEVFEPFHTTKEQGLGMGLAISRTLVTGLGGRLWAENGQEEGATFHLTLPLAAQPALA